MLQSLMPQSSCCASEAVSWRFWREPERMAVFKDTCWRMAKLVVLPLGAAFVAEYFVKLYLPEDALAGLVGRDNPLSVPVAALPRLRQLGTFGGELGGRGQLPTRGSHGSGRAPFGHPAPQMMVSLLNGTHCARLAPRGGDRCCVGARSGPMSCGPASFAGQAICATAVPLRIGIGSTLGSCR